MRDISTYFAQPIVGSVTVMDALIALVVIVVITQIVKRYKRSKMLDARR